MKINKWKDSGFPITRIEELIRELECKGVVWNNITKKPMNYSFIKSQQLGYVMNGCLINRYNIAVANNFEPDYKLDLSIRKTVKFALGQKLNESDK